MGGRLAHFGAVGVTTALAAAGGLAMAQASGSLGLTKWGSAIAWGCEGRGDVAQCDVPASAGQDVVAVAAGAYDSLALTKGGGVIAWGCGGSFNYGQCRVPAAARQGVIRIAAGDSYSLALKAGGRVIAWGCQRASV